MRWKAALALAALYAFCILMPSAALAVTRAAAHCLTETGPAHVHRQGAAPAVAHVHADGSIHTHGAKPAAHTHADGTAPHDHDDGAGNAHAGSCCGLFCISAISLETPDSFAGALPSGHDKPGREYALVDHAPERINRPPIG